MADDFETVKNEIALPQPDPTVPETGAQDFDYDEVHGTKAQDEPSTTKGQVVPSDAAVRPTGASVTPEGRVSVINAHDVEARLAEIETQTIDALRIARSAWARSPGSPPIGWPEDWTLAERRVWRHALRAALTDLAAARQENAGLREALEPFSAVAEDLPKQMDEDATLVGLPEITVADWVRAYTVYHGCASPAVEPRKEGT